MGVRFQAGRAWRPNAGAKIWMQAAICANDVDIVGRVGVDGQVVNGRIPNVVGGENIAASDLRRRAGGV